MKWIAVRRAELLGRLPSTSKILDGMPDGGMSSLRCLQLLKPVLHLDLYEFARSSGYLKVPLPLLLHEAFLLAR